MLPLRGTRGGQLWEAAMDSVSSTLLYVLVVFLVASLLLLALTCI